MTGYGSALVETEHYVLSVEIRSVNNKFLKLSGRVPDELSFLLSEVDDVVRRHLERGSVFYNLQVQPVRPADLYDIDVEVLRKYLDALQGAEVTLGIDASELPTAADCLALPGVVRAEESLELGRDEVVPLARRAMEQAVAELVEMREKEGKFLTSELGERSASLRESLADVKRQVPVALEEHRRRLQERVGQLVAEADVSVTPEDLIREVAIVAERSDITEELVRLESHIEQFGATLSEDGPIGRKLEFIVQEMFRESNTMASKALGAQLAQTVVDIKADVDRLKEQVLNIE